jgi:hypothetical protein
MQSNTWNPNQRNSKSKSFAGTTGKERSFLNPKNFRKATAESKADIFEFDKENTCGKLRGSPNQLRGLPIQPKKVKTERNSHYLLHEKRDISDGTDGISSIFDISDPKACSKFLKNSSTTFDNNHSQMEEEHSISNTWWESTGPNPNCAAHNLNLPDISIEDSVKIKPMPINTDFSNIFPTKEIVTKKSGKIKMITPELLTTLLLCSRDIQKGDSHVSEHLQRHVSNISSVSSNLEDSPKQALRDLPKNFFCQDVELRKSKSEQTYKSSMYSTPTKSG